MGTSRNSNSNSNFDVGAVREVSASLPSASAVIIIKQDFHDYDIDKIDYNNMMDFIK